MFCSECGKPARGKFCSHCGAPLQVAAPEATADQVPPLDLVPVEVLPDWESEIRYEAILQFPGVRAAIERHAAQAPKQMTGEQFLALADKIVPLGVSMEGVAGVANAFFKRLGVQTGKDRARQVAAPASQTIVRVLCSLARRGQALRQVTQAEDGCLIEAALPSDLFALEGDLLITVRKHGAAASVAATARIGGQWYDWGKSNRCLDHLFADLDCDVLAGFALGRAA